MAQKNVEILIASGDHATAEQLNGKLEKAGFRTQVIGEIGKGEAVKRALRDRQIDLVFLDSAETPLNGGDRIMAAIKEASPATKVILMVESLPNSHQREPAPPTRVRYLLKPQLAEWNIARLVHRSLEVAKPATGLAVIARFGECVAEGSSTQQILQKLVEEVVTVLGYEICAVIRRRPDDTERLCMSAVYGLSAEHQRAFDLRVGEGISGSVVISGKARVVPSIRDDPDYRYPGFALQEDLCSMVSIPLRHEKEILGALNVYTGAGYFHTFTQDEIDIFILLANWTALAIRKAEMHEAREREQRQLIEGIIQDTQSGKSFDQMMPAVLEKIAALIGGDAGFIAFVDFEKMRFRPAFPFRRDVRNLKELVIGTAQEGITGCVARTGVSELIDDVRLDSRYMPGDERVCSKIIVPLRYQSHVIGVISIDSYKVARFRSDDKQLLEALAIHLALIFQKQRFDQTFRKLHRPFKSAHDLLALYDTVVERVAEFLNIRAIVLWEKEEDGNFAVRATAGVEHFKTQQVRIPAGEGILNQVVEKKDIVQIKDICDNGNYVRPDLIRDSGFQWLLCIPILFANEVFGVLDIYSRRPHGFFDQEIDYLRALANQAGVAIQNAKLIDHFNRIGQTITSSQDITEILEQIAQSALELLCAEPVILFQYDQETKKLQPPPIYAGTLREKAGYVATFEFSGHSFAELVVAGGQSLFVEEGVEQFPLLLRAKRHWRAPKQGFHAREGIQSLAALILKAEDEIVGLMFLNYRTPQLFTETEIKIMETFASHAAIAIRNSRLIEQLRRSEAELSSIIVGIPDPFIVTRIENVNGEPVWRIEYANREVHEMYGYDYTTHELEEKNARALFGNELPRLTRALREQGGRVANFETSFLHKNGNPIPIILSTAILQQDEKGVPAKTIGIAKDLSNRKKLEKQLEHLNQAMIALLNATTIDQAYNIVFSNLRKIGYDKGMISRVEESTKQIIAERAMGDNWLKIIGHTRRDTEGDDILAVVARNKQAELIIDCRADPRCDQPAIQQAGIKSQYVIPLIAQGKVIGTLQIDLTDKQDLLNGDKYFLAESLNILAGFANQIAAALEANKRMITIDKLRRTLSDVSHEFRSPLHNIITHLGWLRYYIERQYRDDEAVQKRVKIVEEESFRADRQMKNALYSTNQSLEALGLNLQEGCLIDTIKLCAHRYLERALNRGIHIIIYDNVKKLPPVYYDKAQMEQVFTNLLDNAVKYSHFNQNVEIRGRELGGYVEIAMMDKGLGIPANQYDRIFDPYSRSEILDTSRYIPGTGLGLTIVKEILKHHDGKITVDSTPFVKDPHRVRNFDGYETTFYVVLPRHPKGGQ